MERLLILTGASGGGKTTLAHAVQALEPECEVLFFDSVGVPSAEVMASFGPGHQPGGAWQRAMTMQWMKRIAPKVAAGRRVLFEGQMRIAFIQEVLAAEEIAGARIVLVDCSDAVRRARLIHDRAQPELAAESTMNWGRYLREEAVAAGCDVLDTGEIDFEESVRRVRLLSI